MNFNDKTTKLLSICTTPTREKKKTQQAHPKIQERFVTKRVLLCAIVNEQNYSFDSHTAEIIKTIQMKHTLDLAGITSSKNAPHTTTQTQDSRVDPNDHQTYVAFLLAKHFSLNQFNKQIYFVKYIRSKSL